MKWILKKVLKMICCSYTVVENLGLLEKNSTRVKTRAKSYWDTNPTGIKTILNQIIDQELPMDELAECSSTALNHVAVLRYAGRYYRGKIKTLYEEVKRLQTALQHSEKKVGHVLETSLIQNVVNTYLNKGEFRQKNDTSVSFYVMSHSIPDAEIQDHTSFTISQY